MLALQRCCNHLPGCRMSIPQCIILEIPDALSQWLHICFDRGFQWKTACCNVVNIPYSRSSVHDVHSHKHSFYNIISIAAWESWLGFGLFYDHRLLSRALISQRSIGHPIYILWQSHFAFVTFRHFIFSPNCHYSPKLAFCLSLPSHLNPKFCKVLYLHTWERVFVTLSKRPVCPPL